MPTTLLVGTVFGYQRLTGFLLMVFTCDVLVLGTGARGQQEGEISRGKAGVRSETI